MTIYCKPHNATFQTDATCRARRAQLAAIKKQSHLRPMYIGGWKAELEACRDCGVELKEKEGE